MATRLAKRVLAGLGLAVAAALFSGAGVLGPTAGTAGAQEVVTVTIGPGRDASQTGTATLTAQGSQTEVTLDIQPGPAGVEQPAHIHDGTCADVGAVKYPLTNVVDGTSTTTVDAPLGELQAGNLVINIHQSQDEIATYVGCGAIEAAAAAAPAAPAPASSLPAAGSGGLMSPQGSGPSTWWYALAAAGGLLTVVGAFGFVRARRRA